VRHSFKGAALYASVVMLLGTVAIGFATPTTHTVRSAVPTVAQAPAAAIIRPAPALVTPPGTVVVSPAPMKPAKSHERIATVPRPLPVPVNSNTAEHSSHSTTGN
jgi:hypothetical protein